MSPGQANAAICAAQITQRFNCFAATLEQPFKDTAAEFPQSTTGWNAERSKRLGDSLLHGNGQFWNTDLIQMDTIVSSNDQHWSKNQFIVPHGLYLDRWGFLWATDTALQQRQLHDFEIL